MTEQIFSYFRRRLRAQILIYSRVNSGFPRGASLAVKKSSSIHKPANSIQIGTNQRGWLMPVAAFIIVVMGIMAAGLLRIVSQQSISSAQESISVQTFFAAESGAQYAMNRLFYDTGSVIVPVAADANCAAVNGSTLTFTAAGMIGCQVNLSCGVSVDIATATSFYQIGSDAQCLVGNMSAQRIVDVSAYLQ